MSRTRQDSRYSQTVLLFAARGAISAENCLFCRTVCCINNLGVLASMLSFPVSCNVAFGEPVSSKQGRFRLTLLDFVIRQAVQLAG